MLNISKVLKLKDLVLVDQIRHALVSTVIREMYDEENDSSDGLDSGPNVLFIHSAIEKCAMEFPKLQNTQVLQSHFGTMNEDEQGEFDNVMHFHAQLISKEPLKVEDAPKDYILHRLFSICVQYKFDIAVTSIGDLKVNVEFDKITVDHESCISAEEIEEMLEEDGFDSEDFDDEDDNDEPSSEELAEYIEEQQLDYHMDLTKKRMKDGLQ